MGARGDWGSQQLLQLATLFTYAQLMPSTIHACGMSVFLKAATRLQTLDICCHSCLDAARAACLIIPCTSVKEVSVRGMHFPCRYPASLEVLKVYGHLDLPANVCAVLLYQLAALPLRLQHLRRLEILGDRTPQLTTDVTLPRLEELRVSVQEGLVHANLLTWLGYQPCDRLWLEVHVHASAEASTAAVSWLQGSRAYAVVLRSWLPLSQEVQQIWQGVPSSLHRELNLSGTDIHSAEDAAAVLQTLPSWDQLTFEVEAATTELSWADLTGRVGTTRVNGYPGHHLTIVGCTGLPPNHITTPWQLLIEGGVRVCGQNLPAFQMLMSGAQVSRPTLKLLNKAAVAAGW